MKEKHGDKCQGHPLKEVKISSSKEGETTGRGAGSAAFPHKPFVDFFTVYLYTFDKGEKN